MQTFAKSNISPKFHDAVKAGGASSRAVNNILRAGVQPKLKIGAVNDPAEVEADRVADQVMRMPAPANEGAQISTKANPSDINRKCTDCGEEEKIQRKETPDIRMKETGGTGGHTASAEASAAINSLGSGTPLQASERAFFEPRFGQDLSHIRVHTGGTADAASQSINARAFSLGNNIAFASGEYQPSTHSGRTLMAHEITHTLQGDGKVNRVVRRAYEEQYDDDGPDCSASHRSYAPTASNCNAYSRNAWWLPTAYVWNATCACLHTPNTKTANCVRHTLQDRLERTPRAIKLTALAMKPKEISDPPVYHAFVQSVLTPLIYTDHVIAYRDCCCTHGPAPYPAWMAVATIPVIPCSLVGTTIRYLGGSCHGTTGCW